MRPKLIAVVVCVVVALLPSVGLAHATPASGSYRSQLLNFSLHVGPGGATPCTIVGELFVRDGAGPNDRVPAILTTNGFGDSYHDQVPTAAMFAAHGYVSLAYRGWASADPAARSPWTIRITTVRPPHSW